MNISLNHSSHTTVLRSYLGTLILSEEWLRLQSWPKTKAAKVAMQYTGKLNIRDMLQKRQFRKTRDNAHYAAALYRYIREYALKLREYCTMVSIDDKHRLKVGEPGFPVGAAERGRCVMVCAGTTFEVGDHDFTKFSIIPSVVLLIDIPERIDDSWHQEQVLVGFKDAAFESSSPYVMPLNCPGYSEAKKSTANLFYLCTVMVDPTTE